MPRRLQRKQESRQWITRGPSDDQPCAGVNRAVIQLSTYALAAEDIRLRFQINRTNVSVGIPIIKINSTISEALNTRFPLIISAKVFTSAGPR